MRSINKTIIKFDFLLLQRATLAEKEVNALKEQLTSAKNQTKSESGEQLLSNKMADCEQQTLELISRNNIEGELASKDKEVRDFICFNTRT